MTSTRLEQSERAIGTNPTTRRLEHWTCSKSIWLPTFDTVDVPTCLAGMTAVYYSERMKSLTVRLPDQLVREIEAESRVRDCAKSDVVRERLQRGAEPTSSASARLSLIADLIGSVDGLPSDMSGRRKRYLKTTGYGKKLAR
jgi:hypothetical protein